MSVVLTKGCSPNPPMHRQYASAKYRDCLRKTACSSHDSFATQGVKSFPKQKHPSLPSSQDWEEGQGEEGILEEGLQLLAHVGHVDLGGFDLLWDKLRVQKV
jgi:hypothetical protein